MGGLIQSRGENGVIIQIITNLWQCGWGGGGVEPVVASVTQETFMVIDDR